MSTTVTQLIQYYVNLLIIQYFNLPKASATIAADVTPVIMPQVPQQGYIVTPIAPTSGTYVLQYDGVNSGTINWDSDSAAIQVALRQIPALSQVTVSGDIAATVVITFAGGIYFSELLVVTSNSLMSGITPVDIIMKYITPFILTFSQVPQSGTFSFKFNDIIPAISIQYNATAAQIQANLISNFSQLSAIKVVGNFVNGFIIYGASDLLEILTNTLMRETNTVSITLSVLDQPLPLAIENGFALEYAIGKQLDILGKYIGVSRTSNTSIGNITLTDADYLTFLKFAIVQNNSGSSMAEIEFNMNLIFEGQFLIFDYKSMNMSYVLSTTLGSAQFFAVLLAAQLLPRPMAVGVSVIIADVVQNFFGFRTYDAPNLAAKPFNNYNTFDTTWIFLSYANAYFL